MTLTDPSLRFIPSERAKLCQPALHQIEPVIAEEELAAADHAGDAEDAALDRFAVVGLESLAVIGIGRRRGDRGAVQAAGGAERGEGRKIRDVAALAPIGAVDGKREG